jgi:hypothetical protein
MTEMLQDGFRLNDFGEIVADSEAEEDESTQLRENEAEVTLNEVAKELREFKKKSKLEWTELANRIQVLEPGVSTAVKEKKSNQRLINDKLKLNRSQNKVGTKNTASKEFQQEFNLRSLLEENNRHKRQIKMLRISTKQQRNCAQRPWNQRRSYNYGIHNDSQDHQMGCQSGGLNQNLNFGDRLQLAKRRRMG